MGIFSAKIPNLMDFMSEDAGLFYPGQEAEPVGHRGRTPSRDRARTSWPLESIHPSKTYPRIPLFLYSCAKAFQAAPLCQTLHCLPLRIGTAIARKEADQRQESAQPRSSGPT